MPLTEQARAEIIALFDDWNASLATGDPARVTELFAPDAVMLPTISNWVLTDHDRIFEYFERFMALKPQGRVEKSHVRLYGDIALHAGIYRFTMGATGEEVGARFTFVYRRENGNWMIEHQHSSTLPEKE